LNNSQEKIAKKQQKLKEILEQMGLFKPTASLNNISQARILLDQLNNIKKSPVPLKP
jgi:hypothetical protein